MVEPTQMRDETEEPSTANVLSPEQETALVATSKPRSDGLIVWAVLSIGLLAFIAFGSVDARIWRFGNLRIEPRSVLRVWTLQAESLPTVSQQWLLTTLFYCCIILFIACTLIGIWLLLDSAGTGLSRSATASEPDRNDG